MVIPFALLCITCRKVRLLQKTPKRATMCSESWRIARKIVPLMLTLKSSLAVDDCWPAYLLDLVNVAGLMGNAYIVIMLWNFLY